MTDAFTEEIVWERLFSKHVRPRGRDVAVAGGDLGGQTRSHAFVAFALLATTSVHFLAVQHLNIETSGRSLLLTAPPMMPEAVEVRKTEGGGA